MQLAETVFFSQRVEVNSSYQERRDCIDQRLVSFLRECGYLPISLPNIEEMLPDYFRLVSPKAIVLTGGNSLERYGGNAPERDKTDKYLIEKSIEKDIPLIGICRGMQSILDYFGEELVKVKGHVATRHFISAINGKNACFNREVNSFHNQGLYEIKSDALIVLATSEDGVVKSVIHRSKPIMGIMWHPERECSFSILDKNLFRDLIEKRKIEN
ncbi:gamma-glutamyl-gamma-aminobutyrate hydrolase family protein [Succinivibrio sp.]|uniref:gamma-glutamyl-gamma-aminobutyrate hydrolase family protein n=1 Tax=Succinivibrio sp. TaxID=2053619 RepID=UPI0025E0E8DD|nr:gamma-glutamyl-gamma-aminobutyrate hydrolase family protein [Succinivibrio sp.]MBQ9219655.1 gamma-glutamyl-gamma-aminobutyrate hydrolase family protein [Succinivibrio sp.]